jgi:hypothetical protein
MNDHLVIQMVCDAHPIVLFSSAQSLMIRGWHRQLVAGVAQQQEVFAQKLRGTGWREPYPDLFLIDQSLCYFAGVS